MRRKQLLAWGMCLVLIAGLLAGCAQPRETAETPQEPAASETPVEEVELTVAGGWSECRALDIVAAEFTKAYPNVTITYEYLQDYYA